MLKNRKRIHRRRGLRSRYKQGNRSYRKKLSKKDTIIDKKVLKKVKNNSTMDIDVFVVVKELISTQKEIEIEKD